ncbi:MAG TPA: DsbA family protein [Candidatus Magasanikbacteria bacterium]|nr:DsbA family protein [Candidatus Magasanikbacteria bacterium]
MNKTTKTGIILIAGIILTLSIFFFSVIKNTPPTIEEILNINPTTTEVKKNEILSPTISIADPQKGTDKAKITIVEFADYGCSHCSETNQILNELYNKFPQDIKLVWKDFPFLPPTEVTWQAHMAARCAGRQNKFWEYHDMLFTNQGNFNPDLFLKLAQSLNLDISSFTACLNNEETKPLIKKSYTEGQNLEITGTPTFYINGKLFNGEITEQTIKDLL